MPFKSEAQRRWMYANKPAMAAEWQAHTPKGKKLPEHVKNAEIFEHSLKVATVLTAQLEKTSGVFKAIDYLEALPKGRKLQTMGRDYFNLMRGRRSEETVERLMKNITKHPHIRKLKGNERDIVHGHVRDVLHGRKPVSMEYADAPGLDLETKLWAGQAAVSRAKSLERMARLGTAAAVAAPTAYALHKMGAKDDTPGIVQDAVPLAAGTAFGTAPIVQGIKSHALGLPETFKGERQIKSTAALRRAIKPGDILLTSSPGKSGYFKSIISGIGGDPYGYHVMMVTGKKPRGKLVEFTHASPDEGGAYQFLAGLDPKEDVTIRRFKNAKHRAQFLKNLRKRALTEETIEQIFGEKARGSMYDTGRAVRGAVRSFLPAPVAKLVGGSRAAAPGAAVCSSLAGMASPVCMTPGVAPADIMPHHVRRSRVLQTIGAYRAPRTAPQMVYEKFLGALPWALRGAAGVGLGYGAYRAAKAITDR